MGIGQRREPHGGRARLWLPPIIFVFGVAWRARASREALQPVETAPCGGSQAMAVSSFRAWSADADRRLAATLSLETLITFAFWA
jgi:hypothetical protein